MGLPSPLPHDWASDPSLDLINSRWSDHLGSGRFYDRLPEPLFRRAFLKRWGYQVDDPDDDAARARLAALRVVLRRAIDLYISNRPIPPSMQRVLESEMNRAPTTLSVSGNAAEGYALSVKRLGDPWDIVTAEIATSAVRLIAERRLIKECANPHCNWMFVDESKRRSRRWCNVSVCGSLVNVRRHRAGGRC
jgi:predicted RNA-binding Zn ribbon-like protein